jgi:uncharacterized membrane protein YvbJ
MAIIECPQCGEEISDQAKTCPKCGFSVRVALLARYIERYKTENPKTYQAVKLILIVIVVSLFFWLLLRR